MNLKVNKIRLSLIAFFTFSLVLSLSACQQGKKNSETRAITPNSPVITNPNVFGNPIGANCSGCFASFGNLLPAYGVYESTLTGQALVFSVDVLGDSSLSHVNMQDPKVAIYYTGPAMVVGELDVAQVDTRLCNAPLGIYQMQTIQPGQWSNTILSGVRILATGQGSRIVLSILQGIPYNPQTISKDVSSPNRLGGTIVIEEVNGQPCNSDVPLF